MNKNKSVPIEFRGPVTTEIAAEIEAFLKACEKGRPLKTVSKGLAKGYAAMARNDRLETAVHLAVIKPNNKVLSLLIEAGADLDAVDTNEATPLMCAMRSSNEEGARALIEAGAEVDRLDDEGWSALIHACLMNFEQGAALLVKAGANLDIEEEGAGWGALHYAAMEAEGVACVRVLLAAGARLDIGSMKGGEPLEVARQSDCEEIASMIEAEGSRREALEIQKSLGTDKSKGKGKGKDVTRGPRL